jgi:hypothetical protein
MAINQNDEEKEVSLNSSSLVHGLLDAVSKEHPLAEITAAVSFRIET